MAWSCKLVAWSVNCWVKPTACCFDIPKLAASDLEELSIRTIASLASLKPATKIAFDSNLIYSPTPSAKASVLLLWSVIALLYFSEAVVKLLNNLLMTGISDTKSEKPLKGLDLSICLEKLSISSYPLTRPFTCVNELYKFLFTLSIMSLSFSLAFIL